MIPLPLHRRTSPSRRAGDDAYIEQADAVMGAGWVTPSTFRFGASGLLTALLAALEGDAGVTSVEAY